MSTGIRDAGCRPLDCLPLKLASVLLATLAATPEQAQADGISGAVGIASEQVLRGVSLSRGAASLSVDASFRSASGWTAGLGLATLGRDAQGARTLFGASLGRGWALDDDWSAQFSAAHYAYPGSAERHVFDYDELSARIDWQGRVTASLALSPNTARRGDAGTATRARAFSYELGLHQPLAGRLALDAGIGWRELRAGRAAGYPYGSLALAYGAGPLQVVGSFIASRAAQRGLAAADVAGERWVLSLLWDF